MIFTEEERARLRAAVTEAKKVDDYKWGMFKSFYNKVGRLGRVNYEQAKAHEVAGIPQHKWLFDSQVAEGTYQKCTVCGLKRMIDTRGRKIRR